MAFCYFTQVSKIDEKADVPSVPELRTEYIRRTTLLHAIESDVSVMPYKRKSRGRSKGGKGSGGFVQCASCGAMVPRDKAKKVTKRVSMVDHALAKELRQKGAYIAAPIKTKYYCVSCAVHRGVVKVRAKNERRTRPRRRRRR